MSVSNAGDYQVEPGQEVVVDFFRPEDAEGVAACFRAVYGEGYPISIYLDPAEIAKANAEKKIISSVARTAGGQVVGHNAIFASAPCPKIRESGAGVVLPAYRVGGLFGKMCAHGVHVAAPHFGIELVHAEPVCNHPYSQEMTRHKMDMVTMALEVDLMPAAAYSKEKSAPGRVSALLDFVTVTPWPHSVFLPKAYEKELGFIYEGFKEDRTLEIAKETPPAGSRSQVSTQVFDFAQVARMTVHEAGEDFAEALAEEEAAAVSQGCIVFQAWLKLASPWVGASVETLRQAGWFLGGALPRWFDEDGLLMQKILQEPGWDDMVIVFDRAKKIAEMVRKDWERTQ
jgi:hypothetical protein